MILKIPLHVAAQSPARQFDLHFFAPPEAPRVGVDHTPKNCGHKSLAWPQIESMESINSQRPMGGGVQDGVPKRVSVHEGVGGCLANVMGSPKHDVEWQRVLIKKTDVQQRSTWF